jgi:hypothetical protein
LKNYTGHEQSNKVKYEKKKRQATKVAREVVGHFAEENPIHRGY